jgi:hypothetical protein
MRIALSLLLPATALLAEEPAPVDVAKVLRTSPEFAATCKRFSIAWEEGLVRAVGEIAYNGGGPCEYLVNVAPAKAHETMVLLDPGPWTEEGRPPRERLNGYATCLNSAFLCAGYKPGRPFDWNRETGETFPPEGETVHIHIEWKDGDKVVRARMSDLLWNWKTLDIMQPGKFVYTGSMMVDEGPPDHKQWFGAEVDRLVVALLNTNTAIIDNVEEGSLDSAGAYEAIYDRMPAVGTRVTVLFSKKPLEGVTAFKPLEIPEEILAERKKLAEEKAKAAAETPAPKEGEGK